MTVLNSENAPPELTWSHTGDEPHHATASVLSDREYGTFEVSIIDMEEAGDTRPRKLSHSSAPSSCPSCASDCGLLLRILLSPVRVETFKCVTFHAANFVFAVLAAAWMLLMLVAKVLAGWSASWSSRLRRVESDALRGLLRVDCRLFNFIAAEKDCVAVYNSPLGFQQEAGFFGVYAQAYFLGVKLLCAGIPGVLFAAMFVWAWLHVALLALRAGFGVRFDSSNDRHPLSDAHTLELEASAAIMALYGCVLLLQVVSFVSRSITMFFCAEFLVYSP
jgi:hypothetical protein